MGPAAILFPKSRHGSVLQELTYSTIAERRPGAGSKIVQM